MRQAIIAKEKDVDGKVDFLSSLTGSTRESVKQRAMNLIEGLEEEIKQLEGEADKLSASCDDDWRDFLDFVLDLIENTGKHFLDPRISKENRARCKQLIFLAGIMINEKNIVYTPEVSTVYRLATNKKDAVASNNSQMVRVRRL